MQRAYQVAGAVLLAVAVFVGWRAVEMKFYTVLGPGAGFFPLILAVLLAVLAVALAVRATVGPAEPPAQHDVAQTSRAGLMRVGMVVAALAAAAVLLERIGFRPTLFAFLLFLLLALGRRNWPAALAVALAFSVGVHFVFTSLLGVPLPDDGLGF